jgi:hypothetical protein
MVRSFLSKGAATTPPVPDRTFGVMLSITWQVMGFADGLG